MKVTFEVPATIYDLELGRYQEFENIISSNKDLEGMDNFLTMKMVSIFCNFPLQNLEKIPVKDYEKVVSHLNSLFKDKGKFKEIIEIDGIKFGFIPKLDDLTLGEYVDIDNYIKEVKHYHKLMAVLYRPIIAKIGNSYVIEPYEGSEKYAETMRKASVGHTMGALLFFWSLTAELLTATKNYLAEESKKTSMENGQPLLGNLAGISQSTISALEMSLELMQSQNNLFTSVSLN